MQRSSGTAPSSASKKSLFDRISSPFASKSRTVAEFTVQADDPHRRYSPGDVVKGSVTLKLLKPIRVTHIVVCLHGFVQVYKTPGVAPPDGFRAHNTLIGKGRGKRRGEYFGNGFATLFEDETVVCGDGRLEGGGFVFQFKMRFPDETLPSSIDFERGTVSYMITATMTRPNSMTPMVFHDQKLHLNERIDISKLLPPRPRTITLEPLLKRSQAKSISSRRRAADSTRQDDNSGSLARDSRSIMSESQASTPAEWSNARSPSPGGQSATSRRSTNRRGSVSVRSSRASDNGSVPLESGGSNSRRHNQPIVVHVESLRGGTLRGDTIPLRIIVHHTKHVRSMQGVIITLYRQARVDTHPALALGPTTDGEKGKFEDYYPKSITGLGGLSLSGAGSSHMFRKDLSQITLPLLVDPTSLTTELNPKLRVPEDVFPTIACVPGAMISFKYYLEVILDIQGKLAGSDRYFPSTSDGPSTKPVDLETASIDRLVSSSSYVDTTAIRRDKSVITCVLEIVVGTHDSERKKGKARAGADPIHRGAGNVSSSPLDGAVPQEYGVRASDTNGTDSSHAPAPDHGENGGFPDQAEYDGYDGSSYESSPYDHYDHDYDYHYHDNYHHEGQQYYYNHHQAPPGFAPPEFEPPDMPRDEDLTDKERAIRAEARLLPSQPPPVADGGTTSAWMPSAPSFGDHPQTLDSSSASNHRVSSAPRYSQLGFAGPAAVEAITSASLQAPFDASFVMYHHDEAPPVAAAVEEEEEEGGEEEDAVTTPRRADGQQQQQQQQQRDPYAAVAPSRAELEELERAGAEEQARPAGVEGRLPRYER